MEFDSTPVFDSEPVFEEPATNKIDTSHVLDTAPVFETPKEPGMVEQVFGAPARETSEEYNANVASKIESIKANYDMLEAYRRLDDMKDENQKQRRIKAESLKDSDLVKAPWYSSRTFTINSMAGYAQKRGKELEGNPDAKTIINSEMLAAGATEIDMKVLDYNQRSRKANAGRDSTGESINRTLDEIGRFFTDHVVAQTLYGQGETGLGVMTLASDLIEGAADLTESEFLEKVGDSTSGYVEDIRAELDAQQQVYKERYNFNTAPAKAVGQYAPEAVLAFYVPSPWVVMAGVEGGLSGTRAVGAGYSNSQAAAQAVVTTAVAGSVGKIADIALTKILIKPTQAMIEGKKVLSKGATPKEAAQRISSLGDLPPTVKKEVLRLKQINGWSDDTILDLINGYAKGAKSGKVNAQDTIRQLASKGRNSSEEVVDLAYDNPQLRKLALTEIDKRSQEVLKSVKKKSPLGKIIYSNSNRLKSGGHTSINWRAVYDEAENAGFDVTIPLMKKINSNKQQFGDMDLGFHNTIKNMPEHMQPETAFQKGSKLLYDSARLKFTLWANRVTGVNALPSMNIVNKGVDLLEQTFRDTKISKNLKGFILNSIADGPINPSAIRKAIIKHNPKLTDEEVEALATAATKLSTAQQKIDNAKATDKLKKDIAGVEGAPPVIDKDGNEVYDLTPGDYSGFREGHLDLNPSSKTSREELIRPKISNNVKEINRIQKEESVLDYGEETLPLKWNDKVEELKRQNNYLRETIEGNVDAKTNLEIADLKHRSINNDSPELQTKIKDLEDSLTTPYSTQLAGRVDKISNGFKKVSETSEILKYERGPIEFTLHPKTNTLSADLSGVPSSGGLGYKGYSDMWDIAKKLGYDYVPGGLTARNSNIMTHFMLKKITSGGKDLPHIKISGKQLGGKNLDGKPLTKANADKLRTEAVKEIDDAIGKTGSDSDLLRKLDDKAGGKILLGKLRQYNKMSDMRKGSTSGLALASAIVALAGTLNILNKKDTK